MDNYKQNFIDFVSNSTPQELAKFISQNGKKARLKRFMFRI